MEAFKCVLYSFKDAECLMSCCRETVLVRANKQHENTTSCQPESTEKQQQRHEKKHQELQVGKNKDSCVSVSSQKKILMRHCKFQNKLKACFICGWCPPSQWWHTKINRVRQTESQNIVFATLGRDFHFGENGTFCQAMINDLPFLHPKC